MAIFDQGSHRLPDLHDFSVLVCGSKALRFPRHDLDVDRRVFAAAENHVRIVGDEAKPTQGGPVTSEEGSELVLAFRAYPVGPDACLSFGIVFNHGRDSKDAHPVPQKPAAGGPSSQA